MCWEISIVVNLQKYTPKNRASLHVDVGNTDDFVVSGDFPKFNLLWGPCACSLMKDPRGKIIGLVPTIEHFLSQSVVKSVDAFWYWISEKPKAPPMEKLEMSEFCRLYDSAKLRQDTVFRVFKKWTSYISK